MCNTKYHTGKLEATKIKSDGVNIPVFSIGTKSHKYCCICGHKPNNLKTVPTDAHTLLFLKHKIILSACSRCYPSHLNDNKTIKDEAIISNKHGLKESTKIVKSDEMIKILTFAKSLLEKSESQRIDFDQPHLLSDNDYYTLTGLTEEQFNDLVSGISFERKRKYSVRQSVGILLTKLRTGVSSSTLKTIFNINTSRGVCKIIRKARKALVSQFVPKFLGFNHISRESVIKDHTTIFARDLLASGNTDTAILILDGTYIYIEKSSKYTFQRKTYSMYKGRPLVKPMMVTSSDGYIVDIFGPYLANGKNNDAEILNKILENNQHNILNWSKQNDILVVDRGFRDSLEAIESVGLETRYPSFLGKGEKQHSPEDANLSRLVTKIRWAVESANGHLKRWSFLSGVVSNTQVPFIGDYV